MGVGTMPHVIDLAQEQPLSLAQAGKVLGRSHPTVYRYCVEGVRGVRLETVRLGKARLTSVSAVQRFLDRLAEVEA
jgi:hypothetical protein